MLQHEFSLDFSTDFDGMLTYPIDTTGARPHFGFPFWLGAVPDLVSSVSTSVVGRWSQLGAGSHGWQVAGPRTHRFERVYTQPRQVFGQSINFAFKVGSQFPFIVKSSFPVLITSTITNP